MSETAVAEPFPALHAGAPGATEGRRFGPRHRWVVLGVGVAAQATFSAAITGLPVSGTTLRGDYHLTTGQLGGAIGCIYLGIAVSEIVWGLWTDRFGERAVLLTGLWSTAAAFALLGLLVVPQGGHVPAAGLLFAGFLAVGLLGGSVNGSSGRAVMAWFRDGRRGFAMSLRQTAMPVGGALGTLTLPWMAQQFGFRWVFLTMTGLCMLTSAATWRWLHQPVGDAADGPSAEATATSPLRRLDVWRLALASGLLTFPQIAVLSFTGVFLADAKGAGLGAVVATLLVTQIGGGAARIWSGRFTDRHGGRRRAVRLIGVSSGLVLALAAAVSDGPVPLVAAVLAVAGLLANAWHGVAYTEIASMAGATRAGTALGLENTAVFAAAFATPVLVPAVLDASSWPAVWAVIAAIALAATPLTPREKPPTTGPAPAAPDGARNA